MNRKFFLLIGALLAGTFIWAQPDSAPENWFNLSPTKDNVPGVSTEKMYRELIKDKKGETVVVAVIDGGVDYMHEDLKKVMWVNPGEIAGNKIDDDKNGYVDDIHGWNFIGNRNGENVQYDNLEVTRLYRKYKDQFEGADKEKLSKKEKKLYEKYEEYKEEVMANQGEAAQQAALFSSIADAVKKLKKAVGKDEITLEDLQNFDTDDPMLQRVAMILMNMINSGSSVDAFEENLQEAYDHYNGQNKYHYNPDFDPRSTVGDDYANKTERYYGNPDIKGPDALHGTHVAGIIGAARGNGVGMDGVANNVRIMGLRVVPDGDERDKDVANAIIYAVDNGAKVINMSFGKGYSPSKKVVDKAVKYARKHDVLLVHAAGNDSKENTGFNNYPNDRFEKKGLFGPKYADNWLEVGAAYWVGGENLAASFSNYSSENVDVFAPGVDIYSTVPENKYRNLQGTSMAAPVVAGVAAVLRSYFPDLSAMQVKNIIMSSVDKNEQRVVKPGTEDKVPFSKLSITGGVVDAYKAVEMAMSVKGKKKSRGRYLGPYSTPGKTGGKEVVVP